MMCEGGGWSVHHAALQEICSTLYTMQIPLHPDSSPAVEWGPCFGSIENDGKDKLNESKWGERWKNARKGDLYD